LVIVLIGLQFVIFGYLRSSAGAAPTTPEITLGEFRFEHAGEGAASILGAEFQLHIGLLPEVDRDARARLSARRFKVQQSIEELLRRAHSADFEDPSLSELKRQFQEQINTSLGIRAVSEIIITDLAIRRSEPVAAASDSELTAAPATPNNPAGEPLATPTAEVAPL
jgi:flagellar basal body-associated protein FliL